MRHILALAIAAAGLYSADPHAETLNQIYQQALKNDHTFKSQQAAYEAGREEKNIARGALLPAISGRATLEDSSTETTSSGTNFNEQTGEVFTIDPPRVSDADSSDTGFSITLQQPLFDLAAWHGYQRGKLDSLAIEAEFKANEQNLIIRTSEAYLDVLRAVALFETAKAEENANAQQLEQTKKRFEVGLTAITEVHEAQAAFDNALARRLLQEGNVGIAFESLEVLTGQSYQYVAPLKDSFPIVPPEPSGRQQWVDFAIENNFSLTASSLTAESARRTASQATSQHLPTLYLGATYANSESDQDTTVANNPINPKRDVDSSSISLTLDIPIFSGGTTSARRRQAGQRYIQSRETYLQTQRDTVQQTRALHLSVLTDVATVKARAQAITSNNSALEATQAGYEVGTRDLVDVLVAQRALFEAQSNYSDALFTYILNSLRLKEVAGILGEKDLTEIDRWLDTSKQVSRLPY